MSAVSDHGFYSTQSYHPRRSLSTRDYSERCHQAPPAYGAQPALTGQVSRLGHGHPSQDYPYTQPYPTAAQYQYAPVVAPILPPIRVTEAMDFSAQLAQQAEQQKQKEEKPTGGVAQHLDYDMDLMSSFVAEMSQKL